jgi:hypothetical protein
MGAIAVDRMAESTVVRELTEGHAHGLARNRSLRFDQDVRSRVV